MKFRNFLIVLLAVLMIFALASCKNEPEEKEPEFTPVEVDLWPYKNYTPTDNDVYEITITEGISSGYWSYDKLKLVFGETINAGDTVTFKYRSERNIYQWDVRDASVTKWVYETHQDGFEVPVLGEGGWYSFSYTFADTDYNGVAVTYPYEGGFGVFLRGAFIEGDVIEIMDVKLNDEPLLIEADTITSSAELSEETIKDHVWSIPKNYAVLFATAALGNSDKTPVVAKVEAGSMLDLSALTEEKGSCSVFSDADKTQPLDPKVTQVLEDGFKVYYTPAE